MNKQEALKKLNWMKKMNEDVPTFEGWSDGRKSGIDETLQDAIDIVNKIDEPEKPVVPQFIADWYEEHKQNIEMYITNLCIDYVLHKECIDDKVADWYTYLDNKPIQTLVNMHQFGYEVEKEKFYTARLKSTGEYLYYDEEYNKVCHTFTFDNVAKHSEHYYFTKNELVKYSAWENEAYEVNEVNNDN